MARVVDVLLVVALAALRVQVDRCVRDSAFPRVRNRENAVREGKRASIHPQPPRSKEPCNDQQGNKGICWKRSQTQINAPPAALAKLSSSARENAFDELYMNATCTLRIQTVMRLSGTSRRGPRQQRTQQLTPRRRQVTTTQRGSTMRIGSDLARLAVLRSQLCDAPTTSGRIAIQIRRSSATHQRKQLKRSHPHPQGRRRWARRAPWPRPPTQRRRRTPGLRNCNNSREYDLQQHALVRNQHGSQTNTPNACTATEGTQIASVRTQRALLALGALHELAHNVLHTDNILK